MTVLSVFLLAAVVALAVYLLAALAFPEKF